MPSLFLTDGPLSSSNYFFKDSSCDHTHPPLEHLMAFSIVFAAGILSTASIAAYLERVRRIAIRDHYGWPMQEPNLPAATSIKEVK
jgi:hypothetical protein